MLTWITAGMMTRYAGEARSHTVQIVRMAVPAGPVRSPRVCGRMAVPRYARPFPPRRPSARDEMKVKTSRRIRQFFFFF